MEQRRGKGGKGAEMQGCERGLVRGVCDGGHARVSCRGAVLAVGWAAAGEGSGGGSATAATTAAVATATRVAAVAKARTRPMATRPRGTGVLCDVMWRGTTSTTCTTKWLKYTVVSDHLWMYVRLSDAVHTRNTHRPRSALRLTGGTRQLAGSQEGRRRRAAPRTAWREKKTVVATFDHGMVAVVSSRHDSATLHPT